MSADLKYWYLHNHKLFRNLSFKEINTLCILKKFKKSSKSEILELPESDKPRVYFLKKGMMKLMKINEAGDEVLVDIIKKGDLFGELSLEKNKKEHEYFKVISETAILCTFYQDNLERLMLSKPDFAIKYIKYVGFNFKKIQNNYNNIFFKDAKSRLILLLENIIDDKIESQTTCSVENYLTQNDLANLICTSRQTVSGLLKELEKEEVVKYSQKEIFILNAKKFQKYAENVK